jgi:hypothetical protein
LPLASICPPSLHLPALAEFEAALSPVGPASILVGGRRRAQGLRVPLALAQLEISDARRLRAVGQRQTAIARLRSARLRSARQRLITLGAWTYLEVCDRELAAADAPPGAGSVKTVEFHLGHIFDKLGIRSRRDLITRTGSPSPARTTP